MAEFVFHCPLAAGLHARPASLFAEIASAFECECTLRNERSGAVANLKSTLSIIATDVRQADGCRVVCSGGDSERAAKALQRFAEEKLPSADDAGPPSAAQAGTAGLPRALRGKQIEYLTGIPVSQGIGIGTVVLFGRPVVLSSQRKPASAAEEHDRFRKASQAVAQGIERLLGSAKSKTEAAILNAHRSILEDPAFRSRVQEFIDDGDSAESAIQRAAGEFCAMLSASSSAYVRERTLDVQDVAARLMEQLGGAVESTRAVSLTEPSVIVADSLTPQELLRLPREMLRAIVVEFAGATSHTMILARSLGIPALAGVHGAMVELRNGTRVVVDGVRGIVVMLGSGASHPSKTGLGGPPIAIERFYEQEAETLRRKNASLSQVAQAPAMTLDGRTLEVAANVSSAVEIEAAFRSGADGIGVFRTEMLFVDRETAPTEQEQFEIYAEAARAAQGRPVIIRTVDIGGDKRVPHLNLPEEANPFLGYRGARIYPEHQELFCTQVRAILRASALGRVWMMLPMITSAVEVDWAREQVEQVRRDLKKDGEAVADNVPVGIMIEVPATAFAMRELAQAADFFSLGTNDLAQYFFAADRGNARVWPLADAAQPAFLRLLKSTADAAHSQKKWIGLCGEMGGDLRLLPLLLGLGLDEISASTVNVPALKQAVGKFEQAGCEELLRQALACGTAGQVRALLDEFAPAPPALVDRDLVVIASTATNRDEAIHELVDALYIAGRTEARTELEEAVFAREAVYSTALGFGFAIPHCKSDAVLADSIAILKVARPLAWGEEMVQFVILLAMRAAAKDNRHMQVFSQLARKLMDEEFREQLNAADNPDSVVAKLASQLSL
jgi:phosphoenolpyruvate-protein phosphotransferase